MQTNSTSDILSLSHKQAMIATKNGQALKLIKKMARGRYLTAKVSVMKQIVPEMLLVSTVHL